EVLGSLLEPSPNVPAVMKPVQSELLSMNPAHPYEPPDPRVRQSHSGTDYHRPMSQPSDISKFANLGYPQSQLKSPGCLAPEQQ
ncbi:hypothetical protein Tco_1381059, partial [Tanacetum coccineum]